MPDFSEAFLMSGHSWVAHRAISSSSRSAALRWGRRWLQPGRARSAVATPPRRTVPPRLPATTTKLTRTSVHNWNSKLCANAPSFRAERTSFHLGIGQFGRASGGRAAAQCRCPILLPQTFLAPHTVRADAEYRGDFSVRVVALVEELGRAYAPGLDQLRVGQRRNDFFRVGGLGGERHAVMLTLSSPSPAHN